MILDQENIKRIRSALKFHPRGMNISEIAQTLKLNRNSVAKYLEILMISGQVEAKSQGPSKVYTLSERVPVSAMMDFSSDMIVMIDQDGRILQANDLFLKIAGLSREQIIGKSYSEACPCIFQDLPIEEILKGISEKKSKVLEKKMLLDGKELFLHFKLVSTIFDDGREGLTIIIEDITERIRTEASLHESESRFNQVVETAGEWVWEIDTEGLYRYCSPVVERILGYAPDELVSKKHYYDLFAPEVREELKKTTLAGIQKRIPFHHFVNPNVHKNGSIVILETSGSPISDASGTLQGYRGADTDITERMHTELALAESEKLYRSVIENIQDVFYRSDNKGNLIMASPSWASMLGYDSLEDCIGYNIAEKFYIDPEQRKILLEEIHSCGSVQNYQVVLKCRDGSPLNVSTNSHLYYDENGNVLGVEGIFRDINDQCLAEKKIQQYISQMEFFSQKLLEFVEIPESSDIYEKIAADLKALIPEGKVAVSSYDPVTGKIRVRSWLFGKDGRDIFRDAVGYDPVGVELSVSAEGLSGMRAGRLLRLALSSREMLFNSVPKEICTILEQKYAVSDIYGMGFVREGNVLGCASVILPEHARIPDMLLVNVYGRVASIALQRHIAVESSKHHEELFFNIADLSPVPIAIIDKEGVYRYINKSFTHLFGYDLHDFRKGREWFLLAYPDPAYRKTAIQSWMTCREQAPVGEVRQKTFIVRCKDGSDKEIIFRPRTLADGNECVIYEDVTERREAEKVRKLLSAIVTSTDDAIIGKTTDGTIISWNPAAEAAYGYTSGEIIGKNISLLIPPELWPEMRGILEQIQNGESVKNLDTLRVRKDGSIVEVAVTVSPIMNEEGDVIGASSIARNITARKSQERLKEIEEKYLSVVENINVGVYRSTGDPRGRFVWGNPSLLKILGYSSLEKLEELEVAGIFVEPDGRSKFLQELSESGFVKNREISLKRSDGTIITVLVTALAKINKSGAIEFISGLVEDITERRQSENALNDLKKEIADIVDFLPDPTFIIDSGKRVIAWNTAMERFTAIKKDQMLGRGGYAFAIPLYDRQRPALIDLIDADKKEISQYYSLIHHDGKVLEAEVFVPRLEKRNGAVFSVRAAKLSDTRGFRIGTIETIRDITDEHPRIVKAGTTGSTADAGSGSIETIPGKLPPARDEHIPPMISLLYRSKALKLAHDGIGILDRSARCVWVNNALVDLLGAGYSTAIIGKSIVNFIATEQRKTTTDLLLSIPRTGPASFPLSVITPSGTIPVTASVSQIADEAGELLGFMVILRDRGQDWPAAPAGSDSAGMSISK